MRKDCPWKLSAITQEVTEPHTRSFACDVEIKRGAGRSAVAAAAYRAGEKLHNAYYGEASDYTRKCSVICSEILLLSHAPPSRWQRSLILEGLSHRNRRGNQVEASQPLHHVEAEKPWIKRIKQGRAAGKKRWNRPEPEQANKA